MTFTEAELRYLASQRLGRLATLAHDGTLQNNPVGFEVNTDLGVIDIGGWNMGLSRKWKNVGEHPEVSIVIDDLASVQPWAVRGIEIRGRAEGVTGVERAPGSHLSGELIRIHPHRILTWGLDGQPEDMKRRWIRR
ncbi:PPOX class F420-dependent oxidoreductase [Actinocorallia longicatena]